jgi:ATP-dependent DNA helicase RecG
MLRLLSDEELIAFARQEASALVETDPQLTDHLALSEAIDDLLGPQRAEFLDKA